MVPLRCDEKLALLAEYQRLTQLYSAAIGGMVPHRISPGDYQDLSAAAEKARQSAAQARERLNRHIAKHGC